VVSVWIPYPWFKCARQNCRIVNRGMRRSNCCLRAVTLTLAICLAHGCGHAPYPHLVSTNGIYPNPVSADRAYGDRVSALRQELANLDEIIDRDEAGRLAEAAIGYTMALANEYRVTRPPVFHNILVNMKVKDRGLCIHWTEDLLNKLKDLDLKSFRFHWAIAYPDRPLRLEHSSVVVTARGQPFEKGLVLDGWRHAGELHWVLVKEDTYPWQKSD